jgi:hypothetical protein
LADEGKIDGDTLPRDGGMSGRVVSASALVELFGKTSRTMFKNAVGLLKTRNTFDMLVGIIKVCVAAMVQTLVPE